MFQRLAQFGAAAALLLGACAGPTTTTAVLVKDREPQVARANNNQEAPVAAKKTAGEDFYSYVNGDWLASYQLPADKASFGYVEELDEKSNADIRTLLEGLVAAKPAAGTLERKLADLYAAAVDEKTIEARGIAPLKPHFDRIKKVKTVDELIKLMGVIGYASPIGAGVAPSPADPDKNAVWVSQSGLGMPHRGYYLSFGVKEEQTRAAYKRYVETIMKLIGDPDPKGAAKRIYDLEYKIAQAHTDEDRSIAATDALRATTLKGLKDFSPDFDWDLFLGDAGFTGAKLYVITDGTAVQDLGALVRSEKLEDWKTWMEFHFANSFAQMLPKAFADANFEFFTKELEGVTEKPERWKFAVGVVNDYMGDGVGQLYVSKMFPAGNKKLIVDIVNNIHSAFEARLNKLDWMDEATRKEALNKLQHLTAMVAYPDTWHDYSKLKVESGKLVESIYDAFEFQWQEQVDDLAQPVDRERWPTPPHIVNAFYNPLANRFVLPAGILQPPFFDPKADPAENYGGIGAVIGHEMSHGFDDRGRQFDEIGKTRNWWTSETDDRFVSKSDRLIQQYNGYCPWFGTCVNGLGTLGENIGDLAGLEIAYQAYHLSLGGKPAPVIDGLTGDQRFFLAYGRTYRGKMREELARAMLDGDVHSPNRYRVNGVVRNMDAWYAAFGVKPSDKLFLRPEDRVRLW